MRYLLFAACCCIAVLRANLAHAQSPQTYIITANFYEPTAADPQKPRLLLGSPTVATVVGKPVAFLSGGEFLPNKKFEGKPLQYGVRLDAIIRSSADGPLQLELTCSRTEDLSHWNDPQKSQEIEVVSGEVTKIRMLLPKKKSPLLKIGPNRFLEIVVEPVDPLDPDAED